MAKKRKREVSDEEKLVHESTKTLRRAAKKAKAFEVQKAVRRLKDARAAGRDDAGAAAQVDDCKAVDVDAVVALCLLLPLPLLPEQPCLPHSHPQLRWRQLPPLPPLLPL